MPLKLWHPSCLEELLKLGSGAVLCHLCGNSVELGTDTHLLSRSLRSPCDILAAKPWRVAAGRGVLRAGPPLRPFLRGGFSWAVAAMERKWDENVACMNMGKIRRMRETVGPHGQCPVWDDPQPGCAVWCLTPREVPSFLPDSGFSQMGLSVLSWHFSQV